MMDYDDLRTWLKAVEQHKELKHISGADCDLEMSSIVEIAYSEGKEPKPAILFDDIPGYPKGFRTLFGLLASPTRLAMALGLPEDKIDRLSLLQNWRGKARNLRLIPPKLVTSGPVQANIMTGDQIDLLKFPSPRFHEMDGGRYIGTGDAVIQKDPDTGYVNLGTYRIMLVDRDRVALHIVEGKHGRMITDQKYFARQRVMPVAIAIGLDPALWFTSALEAVLFGVSEYDYAGGIKGEAIEVIEGPHTGLPLPANAEIVIEGECHPGELADEGPFGEASGYYANLRLEPVPEPVVRVKAVYFRDDPILTCEHPTVPQKSSTALMQSLKASVGIWGQLEAVGIPGIKGVWCHEAGGGWLFNVVSIKQMYAGHATHVGLLASQYPVSRGRYTVVVDEDIDPTNLQDVIWAMGTRSDPERSIQMLRRCRTSSTDPVVPAEEKRKYKVAPKPLHASRAVIDACQPFESKADWYPVVRVSPGLRSKIFEKWEEVLKQFV